MALKFYIQPKTIIFAARVNEPSAVTYPRDYITFDNITTGSTGVIGPNQTVLIGSAAGASDLGITRIRKDPTSSILYIGRSSEGTRPGEATLTDNAYITVLSETRVLPKVPFIDSDGVTYFDSDLDFATYGADSPPVANAGSAVIGTINSGTSLLTVNFSASNSFVTAPGAAIASYAWNVNGGTITVGTSADEDITATFAAGFYRVTLTVADDNAKSHTAYVNVLAIDPAADPCIDAFELLTHRITPAGQDLRVRIREDIDEDTYLDGAWCALFDGAPADADDRTNVLFQGWIHLSDEEIEGGRTGLLRDVTLTCLDVAGRLRTLPGYSTVIEHAASPATWQEMTTPDMGQFLHYLLQWQSTALDVADFALAGDEGDYTFKILASDGASIFDQVDRRARALIPDHMLTCSRAGALRIGIDPLLQDSGDRTATVQQSFNGDDLAALAYPQQRSPRYHWLRSNAILTGTSEIATAFCIAPGTAPGWGAADMTDGEHLAQSQDDLNATSGHRYARINARQGLFTLTLAAGDDLALEPADLTWIRLTIDAAEAAQRGFTLLNERLLMQQIDVRYEHNRTGLIKTVTIRAERETVGIPAVTETVPAAAPFDDGDFAPGAEAEDSGFFNVGLTGGDTLAAIDTNGNIYTTTNFTASTPTWSRNTTAASSYGFGSSSIMSWVVDPFSPGYIGTGTAINGWVHSTTAVSKVTDLFGTPAYTLSTSFTNAVNGQSGIRGEFAVIAASFGQFQATVTDNPWLLSARAHNSPSDQNGVYVKYSTDGGSTWSSEVQVTTFSDTNILLSPWRIAGVYLSPRTPGYGLVGAYTSNADPASAAIYETDDYGATWSAYSGSHALTDGLGWCFHVPWQGNADESLLYYTGFAKNSGAFLWTTRRTNGTTDAAISPSNSGLTYGPFRPNFGIRSLDTNRQYMVMAGQANAVNDDDIRYAGTAAKGAIFTSADGGDSWTLRYGPVTGGLNAEYPAQVAFASGNANIIYAWGGDGLLIYSTDGGANWDDKDPTFATQEIVGIAGGPLA